MNEHIELLEKEIRKLNLSLKNALSKPHVQSSEIKNIERKLKLKQDILKVIYDHKA